MKKHWSKFFWADWESDEGLRQCSLAAQGLWMRMLCLCAKGEPVGYLSIGGEPLDVDGIARSVGRPETELVPLLAELERWAVFSRDRNGRIYSRRIVRDERKSNIARSNGKQGGNPSLLNQEDKPHMASGSWTLERKKEAFEKFWAAYPARDGANPKAPALDVFCRAAETETLASQIIASAQTYAEREAKNANTPYIAQAVTWLRQRRWGDYASLSPSKENQEASWLWMLEQEKKSGNWPSRQVKKSDIPREFIQRWEAQHAA